MAWRRSWQRMTAEWVAEDILNMPFLALAVTSAYCRLASARQALVTGGDPQQAS